MEQVTIEKSIRRLERDVKKLTKENENKREREWELEKKRDKLEEYEELLEAIVDLQVRISRNSLFLCLSGPFCAENLISAFRFF